MTRVFHAGILLGWIAIALGMLAQPVPGQAVDPTLSRAAAQASLERLASGDRQGAIREALRGLPADPDEADIAAYPEAWRALWRAMAARIVTLPGTSRLIASINMDGSRMLVASGESGTAGEDPSVPSIMMVDTANGAILGAPIPAGEADIADGLRGDADLHFSRDGRFASASLYARNAIAILDGQTGERLLELDIDEDLIPIGFSPDSRYFAAFSGTAVIVWDLEGETVAYEATLPQPGLSGLYAAHAWTQDGRILGTRMNLQGVVEDVVLIDQSGMQTILTGLSLSGMGTLVPATGNDVILVGMEESVVVSLDGQVVGRTQGTQSLMRLVRNGAAVAVARLRATMSLSALEVSVADLAGNPLPTRPSDYGPFSSFVMSPDGQLRAMASVSVDSGPAYSGQDLPEGIELHAMALGELAEGTASPSASPAEDQPVPDGVEDPDKAKLRSLEFARQARSSLGSGDRRGAILAALKGLPKDPEAADFETFDAAHLMLYRAVAARTMIVDFTGDASFAVSPDGARGVALLYDTDGKRARAILEDVGHSETIGPIVHPERGETAYRSSMEAPAFSPDGELLALELAEQDRIALFRAADGGFVRDLIIPEPELSDRGLPTTFVAGFSPDGTRYAAQNGGRILVFEMGSGSVAETVAMPEILVHVAGWGPDGRLYLNDLGIDGQAAQVYVYQSGRIRSLFEMTRTSGEPDPYVQIFPSVQSGNILALGGDEAYVVYDPEGSRRMEVPGGLPAILVRDGQAVMTLNLAGDVGDEIAVHDLDGTRLQARPEDYVSLDSGLFASSGTRLSYHNHSHNKKWEGAGVPKGRELYDLVWGALPDEIRAGIDRERVQRAP